MKEATEKKTLTEIAKEAAALNVEYQIVKDDLSSLKSQLREAAERELANMDEGEKTVEVPTPEGVVQVTFKDDSYYVSSKDKEEVAAMKEELGEVFDEIFTEKVSYKVTSDFQEKVREIDDMETVSKVTSVASKRKNTPAVKFPKVAKTS